MKPTLEFTLANNLEVNRNNSTSSSSKIIINNTPTYTSDYVPEEYVPPANLYPNLDSNTQSMQSPKESNFNLPPMQRPVSTSDTNKYFPTEFYVKLSEITTNILKSNNPALIANCIDMSGKVILKSEDLIKLIGLMTNTSTNIIKIQYEELIEGGCGLFKQKINPIKTIKTILFDNLEFQVIHNRAHNILQNTFNISLVKCLILRCNY